MDINQIIAVVGAICSAVIIVGAAAAVIRRWASPFVSMQERVSKLETSHETTNNGVEVLCKCMLALMDNAVTGDSVDKIREARDEMQSFLISRR